MNQLNFFTAVSYPTPPQSFRSKLLETVDDYFCFNNKAVVIPGQTKNGHEKVVLSEVKSSLLGRIAKVFSYFTVVIPVIMLIAKAVLRSTHHFKLIDPRQKLEKGMNITEDTAKKIQRLMPKILSAEADDEIEWLSTGNNLVFRLKSNNNTQIENIEQPYINEDKIVFKIPRPNSASKDNKLPSVDNEITINRFQNMLKAKKVVLINNLGLLVLPQAKQFNVKVAIPAEKNVNPSGSTIKKNTTYENDNSEQTDNQQNNTSAENADVKVDDTEYSLIAEERLNIAPNESAHEELYHHYSTELNEVARQLAIFVAKTRFNDVTWRNIPIIAEGGEHKKTKKVALIDLEHMMNSKDGFLGSRGLLGNGSRGLIACVSEEQIDIVINEARKQGVAISEEEASEAKTRRLKEIEEDKRLRLHYAAKGVITGKEPLVVDLNSLGLDLSEVGQVNIVVGTDPTTRSGLKRETQNVNLGQIAGEVIAEINRLILESSDQESAKGMRYILLSTTRDPIMAYQDLGLPSSKSLSSEDEKNLWLLRIIKSLVEKGYLFKLVKINGNGYFIQA